MSEKDASLGEFTQSEDGAKEADSEHELFGIGKIPTDWDIETLAELAKIIPGNSPPSSTYNEDGEGLPFFQGNSDFGHFHPKVSTWCSDPRKEAEANDVLMSIRAPVGDLNIADSRCCIGRGLAALRPMHLNGLYLFYHLSVRRGWLSRLATGSTFKAVTKSDLQRLNVPKPPLEEQRKIASVLYNIDEAIQNINDTISQIIRVKRGVVQELLTKGYFDHDIEERRFGAKLRTVPKDWETAELGELSDYQNGYGFSKTEWSDEGRPIIRIQDLTTPEDSDTNYFDGEIDSKYEVENGDILISWSATLGVFRWDRGDAVLNQHIFKVRNIDSQISKSFLYHILDYSLVQLERKLHGSTMKHVTRSAFNGTKVPLPEKKEQQQIAQILDEFEARIDSGNTILSQLQKIKKGLMQDLLSGTVRTTDTNIEVLPEVAAHG